MEYRGVSLTCSFHSGLIENLVDEEAIPIRILEGQNLSTNLDEEAVQFRLQHILV